MARNPYEGERIVTEYLLFHYGLTAEMLPPGLVGTGVLNFPERCVTECLDVARLPRQARALDLGCAVGRASFELARHCTDVAGVDFSERFITVASHLQRNGTFLFAGILEGELTGAHQAVVPAEIDRSRVRFEHGDAMALRPDMGNFDVVLLANLIDRLKEPRRCLAQLPGLVRPGGQLILTSPYTWLREFTPRRKWLGGFMRRGKPLKTLDALQQILRPDFELTARKDLPFLIREHARKFQLGVAEASVWIRRPAV